jgi:hypothetical protein
LLAVLGVCVGGAHRSVAAQDLGAANDAVDMAPPEPRAKPSVVPRIGSTPPPPPPLHLKAGIRPGEAFLYTLSVGQIVGARARMSVGIPVTKDGHALVAVQGEAETTELVRLLAPVTASYVLTLDLGTMLPREVLSREKGLRDRSFHSFLSGTTLDQELTSTLRNAKTKRALTREIRDPLSAYFALRAQELLPGTEIDFDVLDGSAVWRTHLKVIGPEEIRLDEGMENAKPSPPYKSIHIEGTLFRIDDQGHPITRVAKRAVSCWLSDDRDRVLLNARFDTDLGKATLRLTSYIPSKQASRFEGKLAATSLPGLQRTNPPATAKPKGQAKGQD